MIARAMEDVRQLIRGNRPPDAPQQFTNLQQLLTGKLLEHFAYEERHVFPWLLANNPDAAVTQLVTELLRDHARLVAAAQHLSGLLRQYSLATCPAEVWTAIMDFFSDFYTHAGKEDQLFQLFE